MMSTSTPSAGKAPTQSGGGHSINSSGLVQPRQEVPDLQPVAQPCIGVGLPNANGKAAVPHEVRRKIPDPWVLIQIFLNRFPGYVVDRAAIQSPVLNNEASISARECVVVPIHGLQLVGLNVG